MNRGPIEAVIPIAPVAWGRVKRGAYGQAYVPRGTALFKRDLGRAFPRPPVLFDCPLKLTVRFIVPRPKKPKFKEWPAVVPDLDNYLKSVKDALNGIVWTDDSRICQVVAGKFFDMTGGKPRVEIRIEAL